MFRNFLASLFILVTTFSLAQERCGTVALEKMLHGRHPNRETRTQFESWMKQKLSKKLQSGNANRLASGSYVVPIVVHVIHNGEAVGTGTNISDAQILSQIKVINDDYQRMNADSVKTLAEFLPVAGKFPITFVMAKQDPNGLATNGIVRVKGTKTSWSVSDNYTLKALSYWPAEDYLNLWVTNLSGGVLGFTQLPVSSTLKGLETSSDDRLTDGVVIHYQSYGTVNATGGSNFNLLSEYALGRTATHEIGHFFGLRHVWGDTLNCDTLYSKDYVYDTPIQDKDFNGTCPSSAQTDCGIHSMFANYMNYTDDACMNIFSKGQDARMDVIINNSPRRASLLNSHGSQAPTPVANDAWAKSIIVPGQTNCGSTLSPQLSIENLGTNTLNSTQIEFFLNGALIETKTFSSLNLSTNAIATVAFSSLSLAEGSSNTFAFKVLQANGGADGNSLNDSIAVSTTSQVSVALPMTEPFNSIPPYWRIDNPDRDITWANVAIGQNKAMYLNFFDYGSDLGLLSSDFLVTPVFDLTSESVASLSFDHAYAMYTGGSSDRLRVWVSSTCDFNSPPVLIYDKSGSGLATAPASGSRFVPTSSQWQTTVIGLNQFIGQRIQIAFEGVNDYGNDLYLDNVSILNYAITDIALNDLVSPSPVSCATSSVPVVQIQNTGNTVINTLSLDITINNATDYHEDFTNLNLQAGAIKNLSLAIPVNFIPNQSNDVSVVISKPNGINLSSPNDSIHTTVLIQQSNDIIPLRQTFDVSLAGWTSVNPTIGETWHLEQTNKNNSMVFDAFGNAAIGEKSWLVSPVLDFSKTSKASLFFETSYRNNPAGADEFQVLSSADCGVGFPQVIFNSGTDPLSSQSSSTSWAPTIDSDWKSPRWFINLDTLAGKQNLRFAFVVTNQDGNNLYLDNIEFFVDDYETPLAITNDYAVYPGEQQDVRVTFNLSERQLVRIQSYDVIGNVLGDEELPDTLNQTYTLRFKNQPNGIYIIRVQTAFSVSSTKVLLGF